MQWKTKPRAGFRHPSEVREKVKKRMTDKRKTKWLEEHRERKAVRCSKI
jgi:hypothetical protein